MTAMIFGLLGLLLFVLIIYVLYRILDDIYDKRVVAYQNKLLQNEVDEVHNIYLTMRGWRHDYHNHMQSVKAYLAMDNLEEARAYLDALEQDLDDINLLFNTGNINADAILNSRFLLQSRKGFRWITRRLFPKHWRCQTLTFVLF